MKIVDIEEGNVQIFQTNWGISIKFSKKSWLMIILNVTKKQDFTLSLIKTILEKLKGGIKFTCSPQPDTKWILPLVMKTLT